MTQVKEVARAGSGYRIMDQALARLGKDAQQQFQFSLSLTPKQIQQFIEAHEEDLTPEEQGAFSSYAQYIGILFGY